ncbi:MAG TPA: glycerophosphodiester phosphodiesterase [Acidimicrobiales bacterium]|nr:glycerophosphodiester phosphodiesterase [Acidimicrobiales bacterium]
MTSVYAHRGSASPDVRENTLEAFRAAARLGADGVELDVRRTADGALVIHHDIEVKGLGAVSGCLRRDLPAWMPSLEEALAACSELGLAVNVEVKSELAGPSHDPMERCARESAGLCEAAAGRVDIVVSSFSPAALAAAREVSAELALAWLAGLGSAGAPAPWRTGRLAALRLEGVHPADPLVDTGYVALAHADGLAVRVWTVDDPARIAVLAGLGVAAVITNDVAAARRALGNL